MVEPASRAEAAERLRRRQRWLGAVVLLAVAIIVLPILLDGSGSESRYRPPPPIDDPDARQADDARSGVSAGNTGSHSDDGLDSVANGGQASDPAIDAASDPASSPSGDGDSRAAERLAGVPTAWVVRTGTYAAEADAVVTRDRLRETGLPAFVLPDGTDIQGFTVNVGPVIEAARAEIVRQRVEQLLERPGKVVRYP